MTLQSRKHIFYALVALFFIAGATAILYAQGWRINLKTFKPEKVGAIYIRSFPSGATITLDGKPVRNQSGLFSNGTLISNLYPGTVRLTLTAEGYNDWQEHAAVFPALVTKFNDAVLVPNASSAVAVTTDTAKVASFVVANGQTIYENTAGTVLWRDAAIGKGTIISSGANLQNIILQSGAATGTDILYDLATGSSTNLGALLIKNGIVTKNITSIAINPYDATQIIAGSAQRIWTIDLSSGAVTAIARATGAPQTFGPSVAAAQAYIAWARSTATGTAIAVYDTFTNDTATSSASITGTNVALKWLSNTGLGVLQSDGELYLYHADTQTFQKLADDVKDFAISPDGSMIAALESHGIEILPQSGNAAYARFPVTDAGAASKIMWYKDSDHLFVQYPDHVSFLSIDDTALINYTTVAKGTSPYYDPQANSLFIISPDEELIRFDFPG